jgi:hypothetical protein
MQRAMVDIAFSAWIAAVVCQPHALRALDAPSIVQRIVAIAIAVIGVLIWFYDLKFEVAGPWGPRLTLGLMLATIAGAMGSVWTSARDLHKGDAAAGNRDSDRPVPDKT